MWYINELAIENIKMFLQTCPSAAAQNGWSHGLPWDCPALPCVAGADDVFRSVATNPGCLPQRVWQLHKTEDLWDDMTSIDDDDDDDDDDEEEEEEDGDGDFVDDDDVDVFPFSVSVLTLLILHLQKEWHEPDMLRQTWVSLLTLGFLHGLSVKILRHGM